MKSIVFLASIASSASLMATLPTITANSVTMTQDQATRLVTISYTLADAPAIITVDIQTNGVSIGADKFQHVGGDVNMKVSPGTHQITWQPMVEWPSVPDRIVATGAKAVVKAWASDDPPPYLVVDLAVQNARRFYPCVEAIPGGLTNNPSYKTDKMVLRRIPAKNVTWRMGSPSNEPGAKWFPRGSEIPHYVMLTKDYYMGVFEVTQKQLSHFIPEGSDFVSTSTYATKGDALPAIYLTIQDIRGWDTRGNDGKLGYANTMNCDDLDDAYANSPIGILRNLTGLTFNLPTDAQWEYACRAGTSTGLNNGHEANGWGDADDISWNKNNATAMNEVGTKMPNNWGLYDMHGNVEEVCLDRYTEGDDFLATFGANYQSGDVVVDPRVGGGASSDPRVIRGGEWGADTVARFRSAGRKVSRNPTSVRSTVRGFRLLCPASF